MRNIFITVSLVMTLLLPAASLSVQSPQDFDALIRLRMEQARRDKAFEELREKTTELAGITKELVEEVEATNAYTTSAAIIEGSDKIQDLAKEIEDLAKAIKSLTQGR